VTRQPEISDLIVRFDSGTLEPLPVSKSEVVAALVAAGDMGAARIVRRLPERAGHLDQEFVRRLLVEVHCEIQRLAEEFQHGQRMRAILAPLLTSMQGSVPRPIRVVDIGCGTGYVLRWLAKFGSFGSRCRAGWCGLQSRPLSRKRPVWRRNDEYHSETDLTS
jgi:hypothetical protein